MSDTPRTDAIALRLTGRDGLFCDQDSLEQYNDLVHEARQLERDLAEAQFKAEHREQLAATLRDDIKEMQRSLIKAETALAAAQARIQALKQDAERVDWLEARCHDSGYKIDFGMVRDPAVLAGVTRIQCRVGVGSGPWMKIFEGNKVRFAIDAARKEGT